uniref:Secreted protein n=1 Tax=Mesocestoides corti TaxID=53468 RepID=A0A5K3FML0_MESCO
MSPATRILNSSLICTIIFPGLASHLGLDVSASPTWLSTEINGCVHVHSSLFLHRGYQGSVIGPRLIQWQISTNTL